MHKRGRKESIFKRFVPYFTGIAVFFLILSLIVTSIYDMKKTADEEGLRIAEESLRKAAVYCYATEGRYPQDYEYLKRHYGINIDESRYIIHYEAFASNIMPVISVSKIEK